MQNYFTLTALSLLASCLITLPTPTPASPSSTYPFAPPSATYQIVDMGGILIELKSYARDVEFNETQSGGVPKIRSFGFYLQYPELIPSPIGNIARNYISVGVNTGDNYPGDSMNGLLRTLRTKNTIYNLHNYEKLPQKQHSLDVYAPLGTDPETGLPLRQHTDASDVFVKTSSTDDLTTYITCSNRLVPHPPCQQKFSLSPHSKAWVSVSYQRVHLPQWESIQKNVQQILLGGTCANIKN